jgi:NTE family protein
MLVIPQERRRDMDVNHPVSDSPEYSLEGKVALCLSGGGFRASLFHLGSLRRLNELGILEQVDTICSVSVGSIIAAQLARAVHELDVWPIPVSKWDKTVSTPLHKFTGRDLRTSIVLEGDRQWSYSVSGIEK